MDKKTSIELNFLLAGGMEGGLTDEQRSRLNELLERTQESRSYALEIYRISAGLKKSAKAAEAFSQRESPEDFTQRFILDNSIGSPELLRLGKKEQDKPEETEPDICECAEQKRKVSMPNLILAASSAAALIFLLLWANLAPGRLPSEQVGVLSEAMDTSWAEKAEVLNVGDDVFTNSAAIALDEGFIEIELNSGVSFTAEGPASFEVISDDQIELSYGELYVTVPNQAVGFQVTTENSKIIDLGTEFGVSQEISGDTEVHVTKGKTSFVTRKFVSTNHININEKTAYCFDVSTKKILEVNFRENKFVREFDTDKRIVWRGGPIKLADIVAGGNGMNNLNVKREAISPGTGKVSQSLLLRNYVKESIELKKTHFAFHPVESNPFVDGVFVPKGGEETCTVNSKGHIFQECPPTDGRYWTYICNIQSYNLDFQGWKKQRELNNFRRASRHAGIFIHPNAGITFDLNKFREITEAEKFTFKFSTLISSSDKTDNGKADFWVLTDGELRYKRLKATAEMGVENEQIHIDSDTDFLTLVTTGGGNGNGNDRCIFEEPVLIAE
ncbi:FecR protein [Sedimentisphaera cyanobacteriorum]|uniref:FecR protein n=1 Tax=Sedimentisphaera cyanobacteriorum TaxID=1940790 RepID=A0A1Q2HST7_9BACT|nr:NPCBM/NEW2 domain-containing protein [Sedimentisphaera cyanobacteriorum]AQQ10334.1 FecR protein [Sedimentisphaera cyanobacteriorum]